MRAFLAVLALVLLAATAAARPLPEAPVRATVAYDLPSEDCPDCAGASASAGTYVADCYDCSGVGVGASVANGEDGPSATLRVCQTGFVYTCPVDVTL